MPLTLQAKLLRVLENGEVYRVGSNDTIKVDVRLLSATNKNLEKLIDEGKFRSDLYYRLKVGTVMLPPLRGRREDIPLLTAHFLKEFNARHGKNVSGIAEPLRRAFDRYDWPGNVRELRNTIESAIVQDYDGTLGLDDLPESDPLRQVDGDRRGRSTSSSDLVGRPLSEVERFHIQRTLERTGGNREEAAKLLGIGERTLYRVIQDWKQQDTIREALEAAAWDFKSAGTKLGIKPTALERKVKKWGWAKTPGAEEESS
jgi:two-component system response regulator HydG